MISNRLTGRPRAQLCRFRGALPSSGAGAEEEAARRRIEPFHAADAADQTSSGRAAGLAGRARRRGARRGGPCVDALARQHRGEARRRESETLVDAHRFGHLPVETEGQRRRERRAASLRQQTLAGQQRAASHGPRGRLLHRQSQPDPAVPPRSPQLRRFCYQGDETR